MDQKCPKSVFPLENRKSGHHHGTLRIRINLSTKFQLRENFDFLDQICPKRVFLAENRKIEHCQ